MKITIRRARNTDRAHLSTVEAKATPNLRYVPNVFDMFLNDERGEFSVAEVDGMVVACGKFTVVPDGSAWLETIRVRPEVQGRGIGKRFYERFFELARGQNVTTMRMYTGVKNAASKGLAEHFGFRTAETFHGAWMACPVEGDKPPSAAFRQVTNPSQATNLLMPHAAGWHNFFVMNRTFYKLSSAFCTHATQQGQIYEDPQTGNFIALGARFMPATALHIGHFAGDARPCLDFAMQRAVEAQTARLSCFFPSAATAVQQQLLDYGFQLEPSAFIVMARQIH